MENDVQPFGKLPPVLPKLGLQMTLSSEFENFQWYGRGPVENYPDRKTGTAVGVYQGTVTSQYVPYVMPQETGNKEDVRWVALTNAAGAGLLVVADDVLAITALHFSADDLVKARHIHELTPREDVYLALDACQCGLGNGSCGPGVLDKYALKPEAVRFTFSLRPYSSLMGKISAVARQRVILLK